MSFQFVCSQCRAQQACDERLAGCVVRCRYCGASVLAGTNEAASSDRPQRDGKWADPKSMAVAVVCACVLLGSWFFIGHVKPLFIACAGSIVVLATLLFVRPSFAKPMVVSLSLIHVVFFLLCGGCLTAVYGPHEPFKEQGVADPVGRFESETGLRLPATASVVLAGDDHLDLSSSNQFAFGPGLQDGELYLVFNVDAEALKRWIAEPAPWDRWARGPVPDEIVRHVGFEEVGSTTETTTGANTDSPAVIAPLRSDSVYYAAQPRGPDDMRWHNGKLLAVDVELGRVWFSRWDF